MRTPAVTTARRIQPRSGRAEPRAGRRRRQLAAGLATAAVIAQLLVAQVTLVIAVALIAVGRVSRWRPHWLALPVLAGLGWLLAEGPGAALTGFAAAPRALAGAVTEPFALPQLAATVAGTGRWLPGQLPLALLAGSGEAAVVLWLGWWRHWSAWPRRRGLPWRPGGAWPPGGAWRPGLIAVLRRRAGLRALSAGRTVTPAGFALGLASATGRPAGISWMQAERGVLIFGQDRWQLGQLGLAASCAALRRRKTLIILDLDGAAAAAAGLAAWSGVPAIKVDASVAGQPGVAAAELGLAIRRRSVVVIAAGQPGPARGPARGAPRGAPPASGAPQVVQDLAAVLARLDRKSVV
jgi:hypothetical protein